MTPRVMLRFDQVSFLGLLGGNGIVFPPAICDGIKASRRAAGTMLVSRLSAGL